MNGKCRFNALICAKQAGSSIDLIIDAMPYRRGNIDKLDVLNVMANLNFMPKETHGSLQSLDPRLAPCLVSFEGRKSAPLVALQNRDEGWYVYDPVALDYVMIPHSDKRMKRPAEIWVFNPYDETNHALSGFMRDATGNSWFMALLTRFKATYWQIFFIGLVLNLIALANPLFIMMVYDKVMGTGSYSTLSMLVVGMLAAIFIEWQLRKLRSDSLAYFASRLDHIVSGSLFEQILELKPSFIERASLEGQLARVRSFESARDFFAGSTFQAMLEVPYMAISLFVIYLVAGPLVFVPMVMACCYGILFIIMRKLIMVEIRQAARTASMRQQFLIETFEKITAIRAAGMLSLWQKKFNDICGREVITHFRMQRLNNSIEIVSQILSVITVVALIGIGTHLIWNGTITTGGLIASMMLVWRVLSPLFSICLAIPKIEQLRTSVEQINSLMDIQNEELAGRGLSKLPSTRGQLTFENVCMRYNETSELIINNLSFSMEPGEVMAIYGTNGSGKSTILKIIQGMYEFESGTVRLDKFDIRQIQPFNLRRHVAYVPQVQDFFSGTVAENLRLCNPLATEDELIEAITISGAKRDIDAMEHGIYTHIPASVSHSMAPSFAIKLSLARAYIQPASMILIDQLPNSLQSGEIGQVLKDYIEAVRGKRSLIFVSYREDFIEMADKILVVNRDETPRFGARDEMMMDVFG